MKTLSTALKLFPKVKNRAIAENFHGILTRGNYYRQASANANYRERVYQRFIERGLSPSKATEKADAAALRYAGKQHRYRAETITNTELAFAYNRGAHMGVGQSIANGYMGKCEMVWSTAGTNRVCSRCMELRGKVVGTTEDSGAPVPPLHPRCRCTIIYNEIEPAKALRPNKPEVPRVRDNNRDGLQRPSANRGAFAHLEVPMQKRVVVQICKRYGVDISEIRIKIQRDEEMLRFPIAGSAAPEDIGRIDLFPNAFANEEEILRTVIHEGCHVKQFKKYGSVYVQENRLFMERIAKRYEDFFLRIVKRRAQR